MDNTKVITVEDRIAKSMELHKKGYNCCQAVACAFLDKTGLDEETMFRITEGFGLGMGGMKGTCGAISGAVVLAGLMNSSANLEKPDSKGATYKLSKQIVNEFIDMNKSAVCKDIKGVETGEVLRSCDGCIQDAVVLAAKILYGEE